MPNKSIAVHTSDENISALDHWAEQLERSRNFLINQGIQMVLDHYAEAAQKGHITINFKAITPAKKKAGQR
jgi:predicted transcriptional regulator